MGLGPLSGNGMSDGMRACMGDRKLVYVQFRVANLCTHGEASSPEQPEAPAVFTDVSEPVSKLSTWQGSGGPACSMDQHAYICCAAYSHCQRNIGPCPCSWAEEPGAECEATG